MAKLTKAQLDRAKAKGAATVIPKAVDVHGLADVVAQMQAMAEAQQRSQQILIESINNVVAAIEDKQLSSPIDMAPLVAAVLDMKREASVTYSNTPVDYRLDFERDQRGLMKPGVTFTAIPKQIN